MQRRIYTAVLKGGADPKSLSKKISEATLAEKPEQASLFRYGRQIFLYFESTGKEWDPEDRFSRMDDLLETWPELDGSRHWVLMHDIFHYQAPQNPEKWRKKDRIARPYGRVVRLKPERVASYIFYHYQYQEEKPGDGDKYGIIGIRGDLLFFYCEEPLCLDKPEYEGSLNTHHTPSNWSERMDEHFLEWKDAKDAGDHWRDAEILLTF